MENLPGLIWFWWISLQQVPFVWLHKCFSWSWRVGEGKEQGSRAGELLICLNWNCQLQLSWCVPGIAVPGSDCVCADYFTAPWTFWTCFLGLWICPYYIWEMSFSFYPGFSHLCHMHCAGCSRNWGWILHVSICARNRTSLGMVAGAYLNHWLYLNLRAAWEEEVKKKIQ